MLARPWNEAEPYLKGYLAIKGLWAQMRGRARALEDPQLFLSFVRAWFLRVHKYGRVFVFLSRRVYIVSGSDGFNCPRISIESSIR